MIKEDKIKKIHYASNELSDIGSLISSCNKIISSKENESFTERLKISIKIDSGKPVSDGGFTNANFEELDINKEDIIKIVKFILEFKNQRQEEILKSLNL